MQPNTKFWHSLKAELGPHFLLSSAPLLLEQSNSRDSNCIQHWPRSVEGRSVLHTPWCLFQGASPSQVSWLFQYNGAAHWPHYCCQSICRSHPLSSLTRGKDTKILELLNPVESGILRQSTLVWSRTVTSDLEAAILIPSASPRNILIVVSCPEHKMWEDTSLTASNVCHSTSHTRSDYRLF